MSLTATGPILLLLALYVFAFRPSQLAYFVVFFAPFSATAVVNFNSVGYKAGGVGVTVGMMFLLFLFAAQFVYGYAARKRYIGPGHLVQMGVIFLFLMTAYVSGLLNASQGHIIDPVKTHTVYMTIYVLAVIILSLEFTQDGSIEKVVRVARASAIFVSLWGLLQLICSITHIPYPSVLFNNSNSDSADMFAQSLGSFARIASVAVEPSVLAAALLYFAAFGVTLISCDARLRTRYWYSAVGLVVLVLLLSTSSTAYVGLLVTAALVSLQRPIFSLLAGAPLLVVFLGILAIFPKARDTLLASTINKSDSYSYYDRTSHVAFDIIAFLKQPLLGWGWGRAINYNGFVTLLCNVGIIGTTFFIAAGTLTLGALTLGARNAPESEWKMAAYAAGIRNALIVASVCAVTSGMKYVFLTDPIFWGIGIAIASQLEVVQRAKVSAPSLSLQLKRQERAVS